MEKASTFSVYFHNNTKLLIRLSLGICYLWFGMLKFFPGMSPAEGLAKETIHLMTFGLIPDNLSIILLAIWEVVVGILFFTGYFQRFAAKAAIVHMICTFFPLFFMPEITFTHAPYAFSIVGQYIVKNFLFLVALGILLDEKR